MTDTNELIKSLAADARPTAAPLSSVWWLTAGAALAIAAAVFVAALGPRPDIAAAAETPRFLLKFLITGTLAASAFCAVTRLSRPDRGSGTAMLYLVAAPALLIAAVVSELILLPPETWSAKLIGDNSIVCLTSIPLIGVGPLAIFLLALRHGAPVRPALAGAVAGLLAGGIAATFYAAKCTDDSPLFVATWYTIAVAGLAVAGAIFARRFARW